MEKSSSSVSQLEYQQNKNKDITKITQMQSQQKQRQNKNEVLFLEAYCRCDGNYQRVIQQLNNQGLNTFSKIEDKLKTFIETSLYILQQLCKERTIRYNQVITKNRKLITQNIIKFKSSITYELTIKLLNLNSTKIVSNLELENILEMVCLPYSRSESKGMNTEIRTKASFIKPQVQEAKKSQPEQFNKSVISQENQKKTSLRQLIKEKLKQVVEKDTKLD